MELLKNKYSKWYDNIINTAKLQNRKKYNGVYYEKHHILPKCLFPDLSRNENNLILLTAKEHYICHRLLIKMTAGHSQHLMMYAIGKFNQCNQNQQRAFTSRQYEFIRNTISLARTGSKHTSESKQRMSEHMKGRIPWNKGISTPRSPESVIKSANALKGKKLSREHIENISKSKLNKPSGMLGKTHSDETKQKMRESNLANVATTSFKISESRKGMKFTDEHKKNISISQQLRSAEISERRTGMKFTDEHKANISKSKKGQIRKPHSAESKEKMRQARLSYYASRLEKIDRLT